jgi:hypothetical protein
MHVWSAQANVECPLALGEAIRPRDNCAYRPSILLKSILILEVRGRSAEEVTSCLNQTGIPAPAGFNHGMERSAGFVPGHWGAQASCCGSEPDWPKCPHSGEGRRTIVCVGRPGVDRWVRRRRELWRDRLLRVRAGLVRRCWKLWRDRPKCPRSVREGIVARRDDLDRYWYLRYERSEFDRWALPNSGTKWTGRSCRLPVGATGW